MFPRKGRTRVLDGSVWGSPLASWDAEEGNKYPAGSIAGAPQEFVIRFQTFWRSPTTPLGAWREAVTSRHRRPMVVHAKPGGTAALSRSALGSARLVEHVSRSPEDDLPKDLP